MMKGKCKICGSIKCKFVKNEIVGGEINPQPEKVNFRKVKTLKEIYYDEKTGFCGINELVRKSKKPEKEVKEFLNQRKTFTLYTNQHVKILRQKEFMFMILTTSGSQI